MQFKQKLLPAAILLSCFLANGSYAQEEISSLDEIIITSSQIPLPLRQIGVSISVLSESEIEAHGNLSLIDVLRQMPAIASTNNGGAGKTTSLRIRGEEGFRTLTIIDGIRLQDPSGPQISAQLEHLLSSNIGRVEVLRGPQGLSYGADAGGIINISSQQAKDGLNIDFDAQTGSFDTQQYSSSLNAGGEKFDLNLAVADSKTEGFNSRQSDAILQDKDGYKNTTFHSKVGFNATENLRFEFVSRNVDGDAEIDACFASTIIHDCATDYKLNANRFSANYQSENYSHALAYAKTATDRLSFAIDAPTFSAEGEIDRLEYLASYTNLPGFDLVFGADLEKVKSNDINRDNSGIFLEYLSDFSDSFYLTAGLRHDNNDDFGTNTSYRTSAAYLMPLTNDSSLKFKGSLGTGFRAPSPFEISFNSGPFAPPVALLTTLEQEESEGYELGIEYSSGTNLHLGAVYFDQKIDNAIVFKLVGFSGYYAQEIGTSTSKGLELNGKFSVNDNWHLSANYTFNDTNRPNGQQRVRRPEHLANLGLSYFGANDKFNINAFYRISRNSIDEAFGSPLELQLDDFAVLDLSANYNISENMRIFGRIENSLDEKYQEILDFNTPKRAVYIGIKLNFSSL